MTPTIRHSLSIAIFLSLSLVVVDAHCGPEDNHPTAVEIAQLPRFCWTQFSVPNASAPEFNIPPASDCGWGMNHYCNGLVDLIRLRKASDKRGRMFWLALADANVRYTEKAMKDFPNCSLREHVATSRAEINRSFLIYGGKPLPQ